jgi:hypothetical protein
MVRLARTILAAAALTAAGGFALRVLARLGIDLVRQ